MSKSKNDYIGRVSGYLEVIGRVKSATGAIWECRCICGNIVFLNSNKVGNNTHKSCGCKRGELTAKRRTTHGKSKTPEWYCYFGIKKRCYNKKSAHYECYGGRGIIMCDRWIGKDGFVNFLADMGQKPSPLHSIERINNDLGYNPGNCVWATQSEQSNNKRTTLRFIYNGQLETLNKIAELHGVNARTLYERLRRRLVAPGTEIPAELLEVDVKDGIDAPAVLTPDLLTPQPNP